MVAPAAAPMSEGLAKVYAILGEASTPVKTTRLLDTMSISHDPSVYLRLGVRPTNSMRRPTPPFRNW